ncbi:transporter substrate-binding domain-containing protein [Endozoicomonas sp. SM1973]|uniref:Transporter substrate-binding domain-containing protein n=1 Tax=Spartinivicinus marinus TaxID=2994442 RepID=A0A853I2P3_9GAMM|nr:ABC transporter substrate-binding protein [Spartinivicinus marinus]MCX4027535.1 ABC transporter substrate-binding protein [Spartinivicinus marinus]NYZ68220.1 transporter substrate-binding domain-containing protein [Spartinivicinus marinus]
MQLYFYLLISFLSINFVYAASQLTVRLTNGEWLPFQSANLKHFGVASHIVTEAFANENVKVEYVFMPWKRAYIEAKEGRFDGSLIWSPDSEREKDFFFSDIIVHGKSVIFHLKSTSFDWKEYSDFINLKVGGVIGYKYQFESINDIKIERAYSEIAIFKMLLNKRVDILPSDLDAGYAILYSNYSDDEVNKVTHHPRPYNTTTYHLILSKKIKQNENLIKLFNAGLKKLKASGKYNTYFENSRRGLYKK